MRLKCRKKQKEPPHFLPLNSVTHLRLKNSRPPCFLPSRSSFSATEPHALFPKRPPRPPHSSSSDYNNQGRNAMSAPECPPETPASHRTAARTWRLAQLVSRPMQTGPPARPPPALVVSSGATVCPLPSLENRAKPTYPPLHLRVSPSLLG